MKIVNPRAVARKVPVYENWRTNEIIGDSYEFCHWTDEVVAQIDRQLEFLGAGPLRPAPDAVLTKKEKEIEWYENKRAEHIRFMETVLGRPRSEQEAEQALKAHEFEPITAP